MRGIAAMVAVAVVLWSAGCERAQETAAESSLAERSEDTGTRARFDGLSGPPPNGFAAALPLGQTFTDGQLVVWNDGDEPVTIRSIRPEISGGSLQFLGAKIAGLERENSSIQYLESFPPIDQKLGPVRPAENFILEASEQARTFGYELLLGFRVIGSERSTRTSVVVDYEVGGRKRSARLISTIAICPAEEMQPCAHEFGGS